MTEDDKPIISLAAKRKESERDFVQERRDLLQELRDIGFDESRLAEFVQQVMEIEWMIFRISSMFEYWGIDKDASAIVQLVKIWLAKKDHKLLIISCL